jgi:hypothetical protein
MDRGPCTGNVCGRSSDVSGDAARHRTEELTRRVVDDGIRRYCAARRERIPDFVDRHFSLRGAAALHLEAFGWDMVRTPVNFTMAAPAAALHLAVTGARRLGVPRLASTLARRRLLLRTSVAHRVEWLVCTELLELPCRIGDCMATRDALAETIAADARVLGALQEMLTSVGVKSDDALLRQRLERTLLEYVVTRGAASEIATALLSLGAGAVTLGKLTPGAVSFGPTLASIVAQQTAISSFPLGVGFGTLWYGLFPAASSPLLLFGFSGGLLMVGSIIAAFAGVITDPLQRRLGLHQRRLRRMIDAMERHMLDPAAPDYTVRDRYVARLLDAFDLITAAYRLAR